MSHSKYPHNIYNIICVHTHIHTQGHTLITYIYGKLLQLHRFLLFYFCFLFFFKQVVTHAGYGISGARGQAIATAEAMLCSYVVSNKGSPKFPSFVSPSSFCFQHVCRSSAVAVQNSQSFVQYSQGAHIQSVYSGPPLSLGKICSKTPRGFLKPQIVPHSRYTMFFSYAYIAMIKFNS